MGPWTKFKYHDEWRIQDGAGDVITRAETETLANMVLAGLTGHYDPPPDYPIGEPVNMADGTAPFWCEDCGHEDEEHGFWPSDGNLAKHVCPECGRTNCFMLDDTDVVMDIVDGSDGVQAVCVRCGNIYDEAAGDGYMGMCPKCADETDPPEEEEEPAAPTGGRAMTRDEEIAAQLFAIQRAVAAATPEEVAAHIFFCGALIGFIPMDVKEPAAQSVNDQFPDIADLAIDYQAIESQVTRELLPHMFPSPAIVGLEMLCTWPDGQTQKVCVMQTAPDEHYLVIWNAEVGGRVTGFEEVVPEAWLSLLPSDGGT